MTRTPDDDAQKNERLRNLVRRGADVFGGGIENATGAVIGLLIGGPPGAIAGAAAGAVAGLTLRRLGHELSARLLAPREEARVGYVFTLAAQEITARLERGEKARTDGFFGESGAERSDAEEVWESVLLKSQREPEERKLPYMAHLMANVAFDSEIGAHMAHQITKAAEQLSYRQLCILNLTANRDQFELRQDDYRKFGGYFSKGLYQILYEYQDLHRREYISYAGAAALGLTDVNPGVATLQAMGNDLHRLMQLQDIPTADMIPIAIQLRAAN